MSEIHVVHKRVGGVGHIAKLLESRGMRISKPCLPALSAHVASSGVHKIFFHQPISHLYCLVTALLNFRQKHKLCCVLHEASHYNWRAAGLFRSSVGYLVRLLVVRLCALLGVEIVGVSAYVCKSYFLQVRTVSYLSLFKPILEQFASLAQAKSDLAVVWLRKGTGGKSLRYLRNLNQIGMLSGVVILGDPATSDFVRGQLMRDASFADIPVLNVANSIPEADFARYLCRSRWFLSFFPREGFGLSVFQAAYFGCIVLATWSGAITEWLPESNKRILDFLGAGAPEIEIDELAHVSEINKAFARKYISK
jgi:hypothetical protein